MSGFVAAIVLAAALSSSASAEVRFRGAFTLTAVTNCLARYLGETFNSAYRPAGIGGNPNVTSLSELNTYSGDVYELPGANFPLRTWVPVTAHGLDNLSYNFDAKIYIAGMQPPTITAATEFVTVRGYIWNMGNDPGVAPNKCVVAFRGAYFRRVE
jgi:hypothetical protein